MLEAVLHQLVGSADEVEPVEMVELRVWVCGTSCVTFEPKSQPAPRAFMPQDSISSGSDHIKSQKAPSCGISMRRSIPLIWSTSRISGDSPAWMQNTRPSTTAAIPKQSNTSVQYFHGFPFPYFRTISS